MTILKLKSLVYKYTGVYLAQNEELEYITSRGFWKEFINITIHEENDLSPRDVQGLLIGSWQANNGFARPMSNYFWKRTFPGSILAWFDTLRIVLVWDAKHLIGRIKAYVANRN